MCAKSRSERKRSSSSSGLTPGSSRRKTFRISSSPKTTEELDCSTPTGRTSTVPPKPAAALSAQRKRMLPVLARDVGRAADPVQQLAAVRAVGERVVDRPAVDLRDHALVPLLVVRAQPERQLVELVRAGLEARLDEREHQLRRVLAQRDRLEHAEVRDLARLRREPALLEHPLVQPLLGQRGDDPGRLTHPRPRPTGSSSTSWNQ